MPDQEVKVEWAVQWHRGVGETVIEPVDSMEAGLKVVGLYRYSTTLVRRRLICTAWTCAACNDTGTVIPDDDQPASATVSAPCTACQVVA